MKQERQATLTVLAVAAVLGSLWSLSAVWGRSSTETNIVLVELSVTALGASILGVWISARVRPREDLLALTVGLVHSALAWSLFVAANGIEDARAIQWLLWSLGNAGVITGSFGILRFFTLFPRRITEIDLLGVGANKLGRLHGDKREKREKELRNFFKVVAFFQSSRMWLVGWALAGLLSVILAVLVLPSGADPESMTLFFALGIPGMLSLGWGGPLAVYLSTVTYQGGDPSERRRLQWIHWGLTAAVLAFMLFGSLMGAGIIVGFESQALVFAIFGVVACAPFLVLAGLTVAVLYQGTVDPALMIRRTTVYGILGVAFVFFFAALGNVVSEFLEARVGLPGIVGTGLYGGVVAVLLLPLRGWFTRVTERWVPKLESDEPARSA